MKNKNTKVKPVYNLADIVRFNYCARMDEWSEDSIARQYYDRSRAQKNQYYQKGFEVDFDTLSFIIDEKNTFDYDDGVLTLHLRLGDIYNVLEQTIPSVDVYESIIKNNLLHEKCDECHIFYGNHRNVNEDKSQQYIKKLTTKLKNLGFNVHLISSSVDEDFIKLSRCKNYIPSIRGFSWLSASINPNNVFWEIQDPPNFNWNLNSKLVYINDAEYFMRGFVNQNKIKYDNMSR